MIYTIGNRANYLQAIAANGTIYKIGRLSEDAEEGYPGGYAFKTKEDAQRRIDEQYPDSDFAVFGMKASWEEDTTPAADGWWHNLLHDAPIVVLDETT